VETPDTITLAQLHQIIQTVMGWYDYHLHQFTAGRVHYGVPDPEDFEEVRDERRVKLNQILSRFPLLRRRCARAHASGLRPSRSPLGGRAAPQTPCN
jgi:hypothetical protein